VDVSAVYVDVQLLLCTCHGHKSVSLELDFSDFDALLTEGASMR
jgi:hypothetical protein